MIPPSDMLMCGDVTGVICVLSLANVSNTPGFASNGPHQLGTLAPIGIQYIRAQPAPAIPPPINYFSSRADKVYLGGGVGIGFSVLLATFFLYLVGPFVP